MKRFAVLRKSFSNSGMTLVELMVGLAISFIIILAAGAIFTRGLDLSNYFNRSAATMEEMADAIGQLYAVMPQVVRIRGCHCTGTAGDVDTEAGCTYDPTNEWWDPVLDGALAAHGASHILFDGDYEWGFGGTSAYTGTTQYQTADQTLMSYYTGQTALILSRCDSIGFDSGLTPRGCKQRFQLIYQSANESATPTHAPGRLILRTLNTSGATIADLNIGTITGATSRRAGIVRLSCGFATPEAGRLGNDFVVNIRMKIKNSPEENPASDRFESWVEGWGTAAQQTRFYQGHFREAKLRFSFANLSQRGAYQWRIQSNKNCISSAGPAVTSREQCCSFAWDSGTSRCLSECVGAGTAATDAEACCSEKFNAGVCL